MNIYLIERNDPRDEREQDEVRAHVIAANNEKDARTIADIDHYSGPLKDYYVGQVWLLAIEDDRAWPHGSTVTLLATDVSLIAGVLEHEGIILSET